MLKKIERYVLENKNDWHDIRKGLFTGSQISRIIPGSQREMTAEESATVDASWERFKAMLPVAKVVNDNKPDNQAVVAVLRDPPTLPVGTLLYATFEGATDAAEILPGLEA